MEFHSLFSVWTLEKENLGLGIPINSGIVSETYCILLLFLLHLLCWIAKCIARLAFELMADKDFTVK